jgi:hypothetical protein
LRQNSDTSVFATNIIKIQSKKVIFHMIQLLIHFIPEFKFGKYDNKVPL